MNQLAHSYTDGTSQAALWRLLKRQAARYTQGDHGSLPVELVDELLSSLLYTLAQAPESGPSLEERFAVGQQRLRQKMRHAQVLLARVRAGALPLANQSYQDTLRALPGFFARYDVDFFAHQQPVDIDYQLFLPPLAGEGIDAFAAYLEVLWVEDRFCARFPMDRVRRLLEVSSPDWQGLHINLFEPVFSSAVGCALLSRDPAQLLFTPREQEEALRLLRCLSQEGLEARLLKAVETLCEALRLSRAEIQAYLRAAAKSFAPRLYHALGSGTLASVFLAEIPLCRREARQFIDGPRLPEEALRALVDALRNAGTLAEKLALLRQRVSSLRDVGDLLSGCFWGDERQAVLALLTGPEQKALSALYPLQGAPAWVDLLRAQGAEDEAGQGWNG